MLKRILGLQLSGVSVLFVCQFWGSGNTGAPAVVGVCPFRLSLLYVLRLSLSSVRRRRGEEEEGRKEGRKE